MLNRYQLRLLVFVGNTIETRKRPQLTCRWSILISFFFLLIYWYSWAHAYTQYDELLDKHHKFPPNTSIYHHFLGMYLCLCLFACACAVYVCARALHPIHLFGEKWRKSEHQVPRGKRSIVWFYDTGSIWFMYLRFYGSNCLNVRCLFGFFLSLFGFFSLRFNTFRFSFLFISFSFILYTQTHYMHIFTHVLHCNIKNRAIATTIATAIAPVQRENANFTMVRNWTDSEQLV